MPRLSEHRFPTPGVVVRTWRVELRRWGGETGPTRLPMAELMRMV